MLRMDSLDLSRDEVLGQVLQAASHRQQHQNFLRWKSIWAEKRDFAQTQLEHAIEHHETPTVVAERALAVLPLSSSVRSSVYHILLREKAPFVEPQDDEVDPLESRSTIAPFAEDPVLRQECQEIRQRWDSPNNALGESLWESLEDLLTQYCLDQKIEAYVPTLGQWLAPVCVLELPFRETLEIFTRLCATFRRPASVLGNPEREEFIRHLLTYHDPALSRRLAQHQVEWYQRDTVFPLEWFTQFALGQVHPQVMCIILDYVIVLNIRDFGLFLMTAIMIREFQDVSMLQDDARRIDVLNDVCQDLAQMQLVCQLAHALMKRTPTSSQSTTPPRYFEAFASLDDTDQPHELQTLVDMRDWTRKASSTKGGKQYWVHLASGHSQWEHPMGKFEPAPQRLSLTVSLEDIAPQLLTNRSASVEGLRKKYFILDCRTRPSARSLGGIPTAYQLDPEMFDCPETLHCLRQRLMPLSRQVHICVMGHGVMPRQLRLSAVREFIRGDLMAIHRAVLFLQKLGFPYVSTLDGGYAAWHAHVYHAPDISLEDVLLGHEALDCKYCRIEQHQEEEVLPVEVESSSLFSTMTSLGRTVSRSLSVVDGPLTSLWGKTGKALERSTTSVSTAMSEEDFPLSDYDAELDEEFVVSLPYQASPA